MAELPWELVRRQCSLGSKVEQLRDAMLPVLEVLLAPAGISKQALAAVLMQTGAPGAMPVDEWMAQEHIAAVWKAALPNLPTQVACDITKRVAPLWAEAMNLILPMPPGPVQHMPQGPPQFFRKA